MPRIADDTAALLADLNKRLQRLVDAARKEGRDDALAEVRRLVGGGGGSGVHDGPAKKPAKRRKKRKTWWDTATKKQKAERVKKMLAGRGLKPKGKGKAAKKRARKKSAKR